MHSSTFQVSLNIVFFSLAPSPYFIIKIFQVCGAIYSMAVWLTDMFLIVFEERWSFIYIRIIHMKLWIQCVLTVSVSDDPHCGSWLPCKFPTGIWTPFGLQPTVSIFKSGKSSNRTLTFLIWCEAYARQEETIPTLPKNYLFPTSYVPWTCEPLGSCELWKSPSNFLLCACVRPLITVCLQSCFSECNISHRAVLHLVMQPEESTALLTGCY